MSKYMVSKYMDRKFKEYFREVAEFWTVEDGMLMSLVIVRSPDAECLLKEHRVFKNEPFEPGRMKPKFAYRGLIEGWRGNVWLTGDEETPYPVFEYELQIPR